MSTNFKTVELLKTQKILGIGSYGKVFKAKCDDLVCAAKVMHETLFDPAAQDNVDQANKKPIRRFERECEFMREIRHPNIVQYLGLYEDPTTGLPALLMELMDENLTDFLNRVSQPIPYHVQVSLCHDISLALSHLHSKGIIHRDLSSNNILLIGNVRAKVADFGMATIGDLNPLASQITRTKYPGTDAYMPPECLTKARPVYTEKVDCFSFGVLIVQILIQQLPEPGDRHQEVEINDPRFPSGVIQMLTPEIERRQNHIDQIDPKHQLQPIALDCLRDKGAERPSAQQLCKRLADLKNLQQYTDSVIASTCDSHTLQENGVSHENDVHVDVEKVTRSVGVNTEKDDQIAELKEQSEVLRRQLTQQDQALSKSIKKNDERMREKDDMIEQKDLIIAQLEETVDSQQEMIQQLKQQLRQARSSIGDKDQQIVEGERRLSHITQQLQACIMEREKLQTQAREVNQLLQLSLILQWKKDAKKAPRAMYRSNDAVVDGSSAYFRPARTQEVYKYNTTYGWSRLPDCLYESCPLAIINGVLTTIGGCRNGTCVDKLLSLTGVRNRRKWNEEFPPMPTKRSHTATLCNGNDLIVAAGKGEGGMVLTRVEVLNTESHQWSVAVDLPEPCWCSSMTVLDGQLFVMGGVNTDGSQTNIVYACSLSTFLQSRHPRSPERQNGTSQEGQNGTSPERQNGTSTHHESEWKRVTDLPVTQSTCVLFRGRLLAISGKSSSPKPATEVYVYSPIMNTWEIISHVLTGRYACFAAVLSDNQLMIVGGYTDNRTAHDSVEFAGIV